MTLKKVIKEITQINFKNYDFNISYCGMYRFEKLRTKLGVHKVLPFNRLCYLHDRAYFLLEENFNSLSFLDWIYLKFWIDAKFLTQMIKSTDDDPSRIKYITMPIFYVLVTVMTPVYYLVMKKNQ